jgi:hypothetical protein
MARPTGRYFASTITKIRDARKKENIVVDGGFKVQLRQQLMMKIAAQAKPVRKSFAERFMPLKSYFAVVPALALVIIAVVGISRLPISFKSNVVVPSAAPSQQTVLVKPFNESASSLLNTQTIATGSQSSVKTFPGRLVLPPGQTVAGQNAVAPQALEADVVAPSTAAAPDLSETVAVSQPASAQTVSYKQAPTGAVQQPAYSPDSSYSSIATNFLQQQAPVTTENGGNGSSGGSFYSGGMQVVPAQAGSAATGSSSYYQPVSTLQSPGLTNQAGADSNTSAYTGASESTGTGAYVQETAAVPGNTASNEMAQVSPESVEVAQQVQASAAAPAASVAQTVYNENVSTVSNASRVRGALGSALNSSGFKTTISTNQLAGLPAEQLNFSVYYNGNFSSDERTILEQNLLPRLVQDSGASYAYIYQKDASTIRIEIHLKSGAVRDYDYTVDAVGNWKLVSAS